MKLTATTKPFSIERDFAGESIYFVGLNADTNFLFKYDAYTANSGRKFYDCTFIIAKTHFFDDFGLCGLGRIKAIGNVFAGTANKVLALIPTRAAKAM